MPKTPKKYENRTCLNCGKVFSYYIILSGRPGGKYCSRFCACKKLSQTIKECWAKGIIKRRSWKMKPPSHILIDNCAECGQEYYPGLMRDSTCDIYCEDCYKNKKK